MSNKQNPRREGGKNEKRTEHGPTWENHNPGAGCNSTHVAKSRRKWQDRARRSERRNGKTTSKFQMGQKRVLPETEPEHE